MRKYAIELKWGIIFFAISLLWMVFEKMMGWHDELISKHVIYTNLFVIPAVIMYVMALREKRNKVFGGLMSWKQGFMSGAVIAVVVAILSPLGQVITHLYVSPEYFPNVIDYSVESGKMTQQDAEAWFNLTSYIIQSVVGALVMGVATGAIVALFVKKRE